ncbi:MAG TPA: discoidin domain-containing protein [Candidatus Brocadiia bacterium]|nr:discoidin domain-containing protein [Candidatus Brocadiia bacterium]
MLELVRCGGGRREEKGPETAIISTVDFGDRKEWKVVEVDSQETASENGRAENCLDGNGTSWWHTEWSQKSPKHPHHIIIDTAKSQKITGFRYLPRQSECVNGRIKDYEFFVSDDPKKLGDPVVKGAFPNSGAEQKVKFDKPRQGRYICLKALSEVNGTDWTSVGELGIVTE